MIGLYTFPEAFGLRNVSPFCLKVEMALHHLGERYERFWQVKNQERNNSDLFASSNRPAPF